VPFVLFSLTAAVLGVFHLVFAGIAAVVDIFYLVLVETAAVVAFGWQEVYKAEAVC